jgi:TRAP-type C4-dicarboxylate transport system permease small subunit
MLMMHALGTVLSRLTAASTFVGVAAVLLMIVHVTADVIMRNIFLIPIPATGGIVANYYMPVVSFLPVALAGKLEQHIAVDVVFDRLPKKLQNCNLLLVRLIIAVAAGGAAYGFLLDAIQKYQLNSYVLEMSFRIANWPGYFMLPIGFGLWSAINIYRIVAQLTGYEDMLAPVSSGN